MRLDRMFLWVRIPRGPPTNHRCDLMNNNWHEFGDATQNTDNANPVAVLAAVLACAESWEPEARIIGNIRASDIARSIRSFDPSMLDLCVELERLAAENK